MIFRKAKNLAFLFLLNILLCLNSYSQALIVTEPANSPLIGCDTLSVNFNLNTSNTFATINWDFGDGNTYNGANPPKHLFDTAGIYRVKVFGNGNILDSTKVYVGLNRDSIKFVFTDTIDFGCRNYTFFVHTRKTFPNHTKFTWDFDDGVSYSDSTPVLVFEHEFPDAGIYYVRLEVKDGKCQNFFRRNVNVEDCFDIQNFFTPNGDNENDFFIPYTTASGFYTLQIFNRWGNLVYEQKAPGVSWNGINANGKECPQGKYYYIITHETKSDHSKSGEIYLYR